MLLLDNCRGSGGLWGTLKLALLRIWCGPEALKEVFAFGTLHSLLLLFNLVFGHCQQTLLLGRLGHFYELCLLLCTFFPLTRSLFMLLDLLVSTPRGELIKELVGVLFSSVFVIVPCRGSTPAFGFTVVLDVFPFDVVFFILKGDVH